MKINNILHLFFTVNFCLLSQLSGQKLINDSFLSKLIRPQQSNNTELQSNDTGSKSASVKDRPFCVKRCSVNKEK